MGQGQKSHKGARKRMKVSAGGKVKYKRSFAGHLMSGKSGKRCRHLRKHGQLTPILAYKTRIAMGE